MRYELEISEQGPCDCCAPDSDYSEFDSLEAAKELAEKREGSPLAWVAKAWGDGTRYWTAKSSAWYRSFEIQENIEDDQ